MWDNSTLGIQNIVIFPRGIYVVVKVISPPFSWYFSVIYASNSFEVRKSPWA